MHVTFNYGRLYKFPENIVGKEVEVIIVGYGSDGLNSGFAVEIPEELNEFYKNKSVAHITVSLGELKEKQLIQVNWNLINWIKY